MALSIEQQEVLHAWVDGQVSNAEAQVATQLLARPEGAAYAASLNQLCNLLRRHALVPAPAELARRVREGIQPAGRVISLRAGWRFAALAAAAAIVVSLGLVFGPEREVTTPQAPTTVAQEPAHETSAPVMDPALDAGLPSGMPAQTVCPPRDRTPEKLADKGGNENLKGKLAESPGTLSLNRGVDQPFELSVLVDRARHTSNFQMYTDILTVGSLYGDAALQEGRMQPEEDFAGRDFTDYEGVSIELDAAQVPELLAALSRMSNDQHYGKIVVPSDLHRPIQTTDAVVDEMQGFARPAPSNTAGKPGPTGGARSYLPPRILRDCLEKEVGDAGDERKQLLREAASRLDAPKDGNGPESPQDDKAGRKVKLLLRLR